MTPSSLPSHHDGPLAATQLFRRLVFVLPLVYALSGIRMIHPGEVSLTKRFGRWLKSDEGEVVVSQPGLIVALPPPFDEVVRVPLMQEQSIDLLAFWEPPPVGAVQSTSSDSSENPSGATADEDVPEEDVPAPLSSRARYAVTGDHNLVEIKGRIRYRISDPNRYLSETSDPRQSIEYIVQSALTTTVGHWPIDDALRSQRTISLIAPSHLPELRTKYQTVFTDKFWTLTAGREWLEPELEELARECLHPGQNESLITEFLIDVRENRTLSNEILLLAQRQLQSLSAGVELTTLEFELIQPPNEVHGAFRDVHDARIEQETWKQQALGEQTQQKIDAQATAQQAIADSRGRRDSAMAAANSEVSLFQADLRAYQVGPSDVIKARLRREAWEQILERKPRVLTVPAEARNGGMQLTVPVEVNSR